jgi:hypothetical protein
VWSAEDVPALRMPHVFACLQLSLVILLWHAMTFGNSPLVQPETERLWQQVRLPHTAALGTAKTHSSQAPTGS